MRRQQVVLTLSSFMAVKAFIIAIAVGLFADSTRMVLVFIALGCLSTIGASWLRHSVAHEAWRQGYRAAVDDGGAREDNRVTRLR